MTRVLAWAACCGLACCGHDAGDEGEDESKPPPRLVGRVASVPGDGGFVLIQSYGAWSVPEGEAVFSRGPEGRTANLLPTGEQMAQFVAADIRGGQVATGDAVYSTSKPKKGQAAGQAAMESGGKPAAEAADTPGAVRKGEMPLPGAAAPNDPWQPPPATGSAGPGLPALPE